MKHKQGGEQAQMGLDRNVVSISRAMMGSYHSARLTRVLFFKYHVGR